MPLNRREVITSGVAALATLLAPVRKSIAAPQTTITISAGESSYMTMLEELATQFTTKNPDIAIKFIAKGEGWDAQLQVTLRDSLIGDLPDATWQSLTYALMLAHRGIAQPLDPLLEGSSTDALGFSPALVESISTDGKFFAMPFGTTIPIIYYNVDLLKRAGYEAETPPSSWEEIFNIGKKVASLDPHINGGFIEYEATNAWIFQNLLGTYGGRMMKSDQSDIAFNSPEGLRALEVLWQFGEINTVNMTRNQARQAFNAGTSGIHIRSASGTTSVADAAEGHFELQVGQLPVQSSNGYLVGAGHGFIIFTKNAERQKALWKFMRFAAGPAGQMILAKHTGYTPVNMLALKDPQFRDQYLGINPFHRSTIERLAITGDQFSFPSNNTVKIVDMMAEEMRRVLLHETNPDQALAKMAEQTQKLLRAG